MLTIEQQKLVQDNHNLIYSYMNKFKLDEDDANDYYGALAVGLCKAALFFDENKGCKFSTLAYKCMHTEIYNTFRSESKDVKCSVSLDEVIPGTQGITFSEAIPSNEDMEAELLDSNLEYYQAFTKVYNTLKPLHKQIIDMYIFEGLSQIEIGKRLKMHRQSISRIYKTIIKRIETLQKFSKD